MIPNLFGLKGLPSKHFELLIKNNSGITILNWKLIAYKNKFAVRPDFSPYWTNRLAWNLIQSTNWSQNGPERKCGKISGGIFSLLAPSSKTIFMVSELVSFFLKTLSEIFPPVISTKAENLLTLHCQKRQKRFWKLYIKVQILWESHKMLVHLPLFISHYLVASNYKWKMGQIFVAFSEYLNFSRLRIF